MATNIILKKSSITGRVPNDSALAYGELAINYTDGKLYYKHSSQTVRSFLDENQIISLIDSDYVASRTPTGGEGGGTDSAQVIGIIEDTIDSDYIVARLGTVGSPLVVFNYEADSGQSEFTGADVNGNALSYQAEDLLVFVNGILLIDSDDYTATNGSSISLFVPADSGDLVTIAAFNIRLSAGLDSADVTTLIDSDYINARVTATAGTDSAQVISLITDTVDSAYIQARQVDVFRDSAFITNIIDSDYIAARSAPSTDSATVVSIVADNVDSAYVQARQITYSTADFADSAFVTAQINALIDGAPDALNTLNELAAALNDDSDAYNSLLSLIGAKLDSAGVTSLIDSDYINARVVAQAGTDSAQVISLITDTVDSAYIAARVYIDSDLILSTLGTGQSPLVTYQFTATDGQVTFNGLDDNGRTLSYTQTENLLVFVNGVLLAADDYTATSGTSLLLDISTDSGDTVTISRFNILDAIQNTSPIEMYVYTADSGQTIFSGVDDNSNTLSYREEKLLVYLNGVLLVDSADYTATSGTSVTLTSATAVDDVVSIATFNMARGAGIDSFDVLGLIDSDYIAARSSGGTDSATVVSLITDTVDSAYIQARQIDIYRDSAFVTGIIDSDYISARVSAGTDSATVVSIVTDTVDSAYVQARQITYDVLDSADVAGIVEAYGYLTTALDSTQAITLITSTVDSAYIQARQVDIYRDSGFITGLIDSDYIAARSAPGTDSATVISIITDTVDTPFVVNLIGQAVDSTADVYFNSITIGANAVIQGNLQVSGTTTTVDAENLSITDNMIYLNAGESSGSPTAFIDIGFAGNYNDVGSYAHTGFFRDATDGVWKIFEGYTPEPDSSVQIDTTHASFSLASLAVKDITGQYLGFDSDFGTKVVSDLVNDANYLDSTGVINLIDSDYVAARAPAGTDSATVAAIVESYGYLTAAIDSAQVIALIDSDYVNARVTATAGTDSAQVIALITDTVDSAFINGIVDSSYITDRLGVVGSPLVVFTYEADSGQTSFSGADLSGRTLEYNNAEDLLVYLNGVLLVDSDDYYATDGSSVNLYSAADSGNTLTIAQFNIRLSTGLDSSEILTLIEANIDATVNEFKFVATNGQTTFTGADYNGNTLAYGTSSVQVYMNGVRLVDSDDYTASNGSSIVLSSGATTGDQIVVTSVKGAGAAVDLSAVDQNILPATDSAYDLGSPTKKFRSLYLSGNTLYLGSLQLKDSAGELSIVDSSGGSVSVGGGYVSTYGLDGTLQVFNGSQRKYIHDAFTLATVDAYLVTGPVGSAVTIRINKNGTSIGTITIADGTTKTENTVFGTSFIKGDYITVDITAVGSTTPGTDLYLNFIFN